MDLPSYFRGVIRQNGMRRRTARSEREEVLRRSGFMSRPDAQEIANLLLEIGRRAQLEGGNPYKAKAYLGAAESLRHLARPLEELIEAGRLQ